MVWELEPLDHTGLRATCTATDTLRYLDAGHAIDGSLTLGYTPVRNFELRAELRYDRLSNGLVNSGLFYVRANPDTEDQIDANDNTEFALQGVYTFRLP